jgi:hypothetical protein
MASSLETVQTKVRRLTRSPSTTVLSDADLNEYINTFVLYDFPEHLRLFALKETFEFYTSPNIDTYETNTTDTTAPLYNFKNKYVSIHPPIYIAGLQATYTQSRSALFSRYSQNNFINSFATGDGVTTSFSGTLVNIPVLQNNVIFTSKDSLGNGLVLVDFPNSVSPNSGDLGVPNQPPTVFPSAWGGVSYVTGEFTANFLDKNEVATPPGDGEQIFSETVPYNASMPVMMLFFDEKFILRPVPDKVYKVQMEVYARPTELLAGQSPKLEQWWQYIAYGAAKKIFEDRLDMDSVQLIMPEFLEQQSLVLRTTVMQNSNQRVPTIFQEQVGGGNYSVGRNNVFNS